MPKPAIPVLESETVRLRLLEENDLPMTLAWRNQDHIRKWFFHSDVISLQSHCAWFQRYRECDDDWVFIIEDKMKHCRAVGQVALYHIDWSNQRAEFGRLMIGEPDAMGKGLAREATRLLVGEALTNLGLDEIYLELYENNAAALAIYTACGFAITGGRANILIMGKRREENTKCAAYAAC